MFRIGGNWSRRFAAKEPSSRALKDLGARSGVGLGSKTTLKVGGEAEWFLEPLSRVELLNSIEACYRYKIPWRIMGRGSNLLIDDGGVEGLTIRTTSCCQEMAIDGTTVQCGAGVPLQKLIMTCAVSGLGGIEYLFSVPGNVGGALFMNAGRGRGFGLSISNVVESVEYVRRGRIRVASQKRCRFGYRESVFHGMKDAAILSARLKLVRMEEGEVRRKVAERKAFVRESQDNSHPNAGTVFKAGFRDLPGIGGFRAGGAVYSRKCANWILNDKGGSSSDIQYLLDFAIQTHEKNGYARPVVEWIRW